jgi:hypothetical protein
MDNKKIPVVKINFHSLPSLILTPQQYEDEGKFIGLMRSLELSFRAVIKVERTVMSEHEFEKLDAWEG